MKVSDAQDPDKKNDFLVIPEPTQVQRVNSDLQSSSKKKNLGPLQKVDGTAGDDSPSLKFMRPKLEHRMSLRERKKFYGSMDDFFMNLSPDALRKYCARLSWKEDEFYVSRTELLREL